MPIDETTIDPEDRIPRVTSANWKYENGAVGSLSHMLVLQGYRYSCELEVCESPFRCDRILLLFDQSPLTKTVSYTDADGYQLKLIDPYGNPELRVRTPESDEEHLFTVRSFFLCTYHVSNVDPLTTFDSYSVLFCQFERDDPYASELSEFFLFFLLSSSSRLPDPFE